MQACTYILIVQYTDHLCFEVVGYYWSINDHLVHCKSLLMAAPLMYKAPCVASAVNNKAADEEGGTSFLRQCQTAHHSTPSRSTFVTYLCVTVLLALLRVLVAI